MRAEPAPAPAPAPSVEPAPAPSVEPAPAPSVEPAPAPSVEPAPAPAVDGVGEPGPARILPRQRHGPPSRPGPAAAFAGGRIPPEVVLRLTAGLAEQERGRSGVRRVARPALLATVGGAGLLVVLLGVMAVAGHVL
ncbi:MAG TPA: hypothetical protein VI248_07235 [Kineosporiaceae bacterium]